MTPEVEVPKAGSGFPIIRRSGCEISEIDVALHCQGRGVCRELTDADMIRMRVVDGKTFDQLGKIFGVTRERIRQRLCKALLRAEKAQSLDATSGPILPKRDKVTS